MVIPFSSNVCVNRFNSERMSRKPNLTTDQAESPNKI